MAAQAPLMMANPMSMFGFNPMNYSAALENAGFPAKFTQTQGQIHSGQEGRLTQMWNGIRDLTGFKQNNTVNASESREEFINKVNVFYDNFRRGLAMSSKDNNLSNVMQNMNQIGTISMDFLNQIFDVNKDTKEKDNNIDEKKEFRNTQIKSEEKLNENKEKSNYTFNILPMKNLMEQNYKQ